MATPKVTFTTGGTVQAGGGVYLQRSSDEELLQACQKGEFSYVLTSRQMGKSSLMTHTAEQLRSLQILPVVIDLQAIGTQVTVGQWYLGLLITMEEQLMLDTDILDWWEDHNHLGLTQRFTQFFEQVLLKKITGQIVIFVDEIDTVLSLDFADDFFIAIRYFHQSRAQNPDLHRLSFVLLGVAAPGDLIRDQKRTPFNIGQPIDLRGFTLTEIQPLSAGLAQVLEVPEKQALDLLEAVLHWTGGQPFLTQKLCQFMVTTESRPALGEEFPWVSELVHQKIIDRWEAQDTPPHLSTIRDRLARSGEKTARLLGLYQQLLEQGDLPADDRPEQVELRLTGLVVKRDGRLQVFNRIYEAVFNPTWVAQALADLRPYGEAIQEWLSSGRLDESRLLRGQALQEARQWAEGKSLGDDDRRFLDASLEIERREVELKFEAEREANRILSAARDEAEVEKEAAKEELAQTKQKTQRWVLGGIVAVVLASLSSASLVGVITWAGIRTQKEVNRAVASAQQNLTTASIRITALGAKEAYTSKKSLDALMLGLQAGAQYKALASKDQPDCHQKDDQTQNYCSAYYLIMAALQQALYSTYEGLSANSLEHQGGVRSVSFSPDGEILATGGGDGNVKLWNRDGTLLKTLKESKESNGIFSVDSVSFSPNGKTIISGSTDILGSTGRLKLWHTDGTLIKSLDNSTVLSVSFSPDGTTIATGGLHETAKLWRTDGTLLQTLEGHQNAVLSVSFSPDGEILATGSSDRTVKLWRKDNTLIQTLEGHQDAVNSVSFSPDGQTIITGSDDGTAKLWYKDGTLLRTLEGHQGAVLSVGFSPDGQSIVTGSSDKTVKLWRTDGTLLQTLEGYQSAVLSVSFSSDGEILATGSSDKTVKLWRKDNTLIHTLEGHRDSVRSISFSPARETSPEENREICVLSRSCIAIATGSDDGTVKLWRKDGTLIHTLDGDQYGVLSVNFSPNGEILATGGRDGNVKLWGQDGTLIQTLERHQDAVTSVHFSPDGRTIAAGSNDGTVNSWNRDGKLIKNLDAELSINSVSFSPDGQTLVTGSAGNTVKLWHKDGTLLKTLEGYPITIAVNSVSFSPDGETLVTGGGDILGGMGEMKLWNKDGTSITTIDSQNSVSSISFSLDGKTIASGSSDTVKLWNKDGTSITTIDSQSEFRSVGFSPDGKTIAAGSDDGKVRLWDWNLDRFLAMGCYWTADYRKNQPDSETNQLINATCERPEVKAELPDLLRIQATETAKTGNYAAALKFLQEAQALDPQINLTSQQLQTLASDAVQQQALNRVEFRRLDQLSELFSQPETRKENLQHFAPLTESRRRQALWLLDRAKSINPNFDLAAATQKMQETWQESKSQIVQTFVNEGDKKVREQQSGEALQQYRYALQLDPTLPFTPESRVQEQNPESPP